MAEVFEARELATGRRCAVKLIRPDSADRPRTRARFRREAELMMRVQHPNVARCMGLREADDGTLYMVQEYIEGGSLKSLIRSSQEVGPRTAVSIILQLLRALDAVHAAGLVHRDVKPSNIMLTRDEDGRDVVKLIDFGLSEVVKGPATRTPAPVGRTLGTPAYVAPEQAMGLDADPRSDVYSASAVLYEMFTGVRVFRARTVNHLVLMHLHDKPVPVRERAPWLSKDLGFAVMKGLRKRQETRFSTARDFARDLARAMRPRSTASPALRST
jgi:serine/threonine protein kinase